MTNPAPMTLHQFIDEVYVLERGLRPNSVTHMHVSARSLEKYLGREPVTFPDLSDGMLNRWIADCLERGCSKKTVKNWRADILALWRYAADADPPLCETMPGRIRRINIGKQIVEAWTPDEIRKLAEAADEMRGIIRSFEIARRFYWGSLIRAAYDTALRHCDLCRIELGRIHEHVDGTGVLVITQQKTGDDVAVRFSADTMQHMRRAVEMSAPRAAVWPLWGRPEAFFSQFRTIVKAAEIRPGTFKWIRRASITARESMVPGMGAQAAGHRHSHVTAASYIDRSQLPPAPLPPKLEQHPEQRIDRREVVYQANGARRILYGKGGGR